MLPTTYKPVSTTIHYLRNSTVVLPILFITLILPLSNCLSSQRPSRDLPTSSSASNNNGRTLSFGSVLGNNNPLLNGEEQQQATTTPPPQLLSRSWRYWCDPCACGFDKLKSYDQHIQGKRHVAVEEEGPFLWEHYLQSGAVFYDASVSKQDVIRAWSLDLFLGGLQARSRSSVKQVLSSTSSTSGTRGNQIDPSIRLCDLSANKRASLWRLLFTSSVPHLADMISILPSHYVRIKELLESLEVFGHVERLLLSKRQNKRRISRIYDIGCGHGLVGMLCAAVFPDNTVHAIDMVPRESFQAQRTAFQSAGVALDNLQFMAGDLSILQNDNMDDDDTNIAADDDHNKSDNRLVLCVHGCKALTHESIELAQHHHWAWLVLPCCLQAEHHLGDATSLKGVSDDVRFAMLCGAMAAKYQAETVAMIDSKITARGIVLSSSSSLQSKSDCPS